VLKKQIYQNAIIREVK